MTTPSDAELVRALYRSCIVTAHIHNAVGAVDPDTCSTCGGNFREHLTVTETRESRFLAEVSAALDRVRIEERLKERERAAEVVEGMRLALAKCGLPLSAKEAQKAADAIRRQEG